MPSDEAVISLKDVYTELVRLSGRMAAIDERLAAAARLDLDHETRLRALERWRHALPTSVIISAGSIGTALAALFLK